MLKDFVNMQKLLAVAIPLESAEGAVRRLAAPARSKRRDTWLDHSSSCVAVARKRSVFFPILVESIQPQDVSAGIILVLHKFPTRLLCKLAEPFHGMFANYGTSRRSAVPVDDLDALVAIAKAAIDSFSDLLLSFF